MRERFLEGQFVRCRQLQRFSQQRHAFALLRRGFQQQDRLPHAQASARDRHARSERREDLERFGGVLQRVRQIILVILIRR